MNLKYLMSSILGENKKYALTNFENYRNCVTT